MSVGLEYPASLLPIPGIRVAAASAGLYATRRLDLALIELPEAGQVSIVFTGNKFSAAPIQLAKQHFDAAMPRYLLINAGNANAGTGRKGISDALAACESLARLCGCRSNQILPFSTGVIGELLPIEKIETALPGLVDKLAGEPWLDVAKAIMTTDTVPKAVSKTVIVDDDKINITGVAKGAGMIKPDMATMLSFIATDADLDREVLDNLFRESINESFNRITVDGDTSTNDACVLMATGRAKRAKIYPGPGDAYHSFKQALVEVCKNLAQAIVRDGEGATKFIEVRVFEGFNNDDCLSVAYNIAESLLVKTAFTASDPNWGRILAAVGNANINDLKTERVSIYLDDVCVVKNGARCEAYIEAEGKKVMLRDEIVISVKLGMGECEQTVWTTDLSHDYIKINAGYRT